MATVLHTISYVGMGKGWLLLAIGWMGCANPPPVESASSDAVSKDVAPLEDRDFSEPLDRAFIQKTNANLSASSFDQKWTASTVSDVMFMRAYPGAYHKDLAQVPVRRIPGREDLCMGDAHPDNFGFLKLDDDVKFVFNDLDDSGYCSVILDAARYFAVLRLYFDNKDLSKDVLERYVDTLKDASSAKKIDKAREPDFRASAAKKLDKLTHDGKLVLEDGLVATPSDERVKIEHIVNAQPELANAGTKLLDVASMLREEGGSGGLRRYWLLVSRPSAGTTILEMKESAEPGTSFGRHTKTLRVDERLDVLKSALWQTKTQSDYFYVMLDSTRFLLRDRLAKQSVDLADLNDGERKDVLEAQASLMALLHANALSDVSKDDVRSWLHDTSEVLAKRWSRVRSP